jgi:hypothetical protein
MLWCIVLFTYKYVQCNYIYIWMTLQLYKYLGYEMISIPEIKDTQFVPALPILISSGVYSNGMYISSRYVFLYVMSFHIIHFILISTAHALFLTWVTCILYKKQANFSELFCLQVRSVTPWQLHDRKSRFPRGRRHSSILYSPSELYKIHVTLQCIVVSALKKTI